MSEIETTVGQTTRLSMRHPMPLDSLGYVLCMFVFRNEEQLREFLQALGLAEAFTRLCVRTKEESAEIGARYRLIRETIVGLEEVALDPRGGTGVPLHPQRFNQKGRPDDGFRDIDVFPFMHELQLLGIHLNDIEVYRDDDHSSWKVKLHLSAVPEQDAAKAELCLTAWNCLLELFERHVIASRLLVHDNPMVGLDNVVKESIDERGKSIARKKIVLTVPALREGRKDVITRSTGRPASVPAANRILQICPAAGQNVDPDNLELVCRERFANWRERLPPSDPLYVARPPSAVVGRPRDDADLESGTESGTVPAPDLAAIIGDTDM